MKGGRVSLGAALRAVVVLAVLALLGFLSVRFGGAPAGKHGPDHASAAAHQKTQPPAPPPVAPPGATPPVTEPEAAPGPATEPAGSVAAVESPAGDGLHFERTVVAVKVAADAAEAVTDFPFANHGTKVATIREVEKDCDCADVKISNGGKLSYAPGEAGILRARFRLDTLVGTVEKSFKVFLDGDRPDQPSHLLVARIHIPVLLEVSAKTVDWKVGGDPAPRTVEVRVTHDQPIRLLNASSSREDLRVAIKEVEEGRRYELLLEPTAVDQPGLALVRVETDCKIPRWKLLQVFARFLPPGTAPTPPAAP